MLDVRETRTRGGNSYADNDAKGNSTAQILNFMGLDLLLLKSTNCERLPLKFDLTVVGVIGMGAAILVRRKSSLVATFVPTRDIRVL